MKSHTVTRDFDALQALYQHNPCAFEALRHQILDDAIAAAPASLRPELSQTLHHIEVARQEAATPLEAAVVACRMMLESCDKLQGAWSLLQYEVARLQTIVVLERVKRL